MTDFIIPVRVSAPGAVDDPPRRMRLAPAHPLIGRPCPACGVPFVEEDAVTLVALGPGADAEAQARARAGRVYTGVAAAIHWACAGGEA